MYTRLKQLQALLMQLAYSKAKIEEAKIKEAKIKKTKIREAKIGEEQKIYQFYNLLLAYT